MSGQHGIEAELKNVDPTTMKPKVAYGLEVETARPNAKDQSSMGGFGLEADVKAADQGDGNNSRGGAPPFQGFGLAQDVLAGKQTAARVTPGQLDRQADVMTRRGGGLPAMVSFHNQSR